MFGLSLLLAALIATETESLTAPINPTEESQLTSFITTELEQPEQNKTQPIIITNAIEPSMLSYKHWTGTYSPEVFTITINDTPIDSGQTYTLNSSNESINIQFDYSFMNGMYKGTKQITYQINEECTHANLTFSWHDPLKVIIDNATPIKKETT